MATGLSGESPPAEYGDYVILQQVGSRSYIVRSTKNDTSHFMRKLDVSELSEPQRALLLKKLKHLQEVTNHQHLSHIEDVFSEGGHVSVISPHCEGGSLHSLVMRAKSFGEVLNHIEVMDWLVQLLLALRHLHQQSLSHGRISAINILLHNNSVKLLESLQLHSLYSNLQEEISNNLLQELPKNSSEVSTTLGDITESASSAPSDVTEPASSVHCYTNTNDIGYTSPEVLKGGIHTDKSDMWGVGCVLFELCAGCKLFTTCKPDDIIRRVDAKEFPKFPADSFSVELEQLWQQLMQPDPGKRPSTQQVLAMPFIVEHMQDMEECEQAWPLKELPEETERIEDLPKGNTDSVNDDVSTDIDDDAILTEEDAFLLLTSIQD